ncbi:MAG TPA: 3-hydroxyacyl-CoA dehydrogenase/enoyl-CoA hydratase family protein, partial [Myxococcota bacterium]|nr:3-hydroxyacyl-CoA dehydrogenase/enoyl-CoA hydratase family protein [Myxococcota bacterium]
MSPSATIPIRRVAVLGSGVMGSGIAAHLANAGIPSVLFDIVPRDATTPDERNKLARAGIETATSLKPAPLFRKDLASLITAANYDDHGDLLATCDWIVEVVVERVDIKRKVFEWVARHRRPGTILSSNTSGIPIAEMTVGMSDELREHFLVTHFFNPVRYMRLLELVRGPETRADVVDAVARFGADVLGKGIVYGKDTPNFVANRVGVFGMAATFRLMQEAGMSIEAVDAIFGEAMGRPSSAVFRTADVVGIDTLAHVFENVHASCTEDERRDWFVLPGFVKDLVASGRTGQKAGAGFYKKDRAAGGKGILALDLSTMEYRNAESPRFPCTGAARKKETSAEKLQAMIWGAADDAASAFAWKVTSETLLYSARRIPEIADDVVNIDRGMRWGFGWDLGPFESWDAIGVRRAAQRMQADGQDVPAWVQAMLDAGRESFYARDDAGNLTFWTFNGDIARVPTADGHLSLPDLRARTAAAGKAPIARNVSATLHDMGDGIGLLEFHSKMNALDDAIFDLYGKALDMMDEGSLDGLVVGNEGAKAFCAGANLLMILMAANEGKWDEIGKMIHDLQQLLMRARYSRKPVVVAPHALTLGGGVEVSMHSTATVGTGELYMGLVEVGVGLIPGAGGCKELVFRYTADIPPDVAVDPSPFVQKAFERIATAQVATSGEEARSWGYLRPTAPLVLDVDARLATAKRVARGLSDAG